LNPIFQGLGASVPPEELEPESELELEPDELEPESVDDDESDPPQATNITIINMLSRIQNAFFMKQSS